MTRATNVWPLRCKPATADLIAAGEATAATVPIGAGNARPSRGEFRDVDIESARVKATALGPVAYLSARITVPQGYRRTIQVWPRVSPGAFMWINAVGHTRADPACLAVSQVHACRLHDIGELDAAEEGQQAFLRRYAKATADIYDPPLLYRRAVQDLFPPRSRPKWEQTDAHYGVTRSGVLSRTVFLMRWTFEHGFASYLENPWVWRYRFDCLRMPADVAAMHARHGTLEAYRPKFKQGAA